MPIIFSSFLFVFSFILLRNCIELIVSHRSLAEWLTNSSLIPLSESILIPIELPRGMKMKTSNADVTNPNATQNRFVTLLIVKNAHLRFPLSIIVGKTNSRRTLRDR